jgi:hypothetical protein
MVKAKTVERWVVIDNEGRYASDEKQGYFVEDFAEAHVFVAPPPKTLAVRPVKVTVSLVRGAC